MAAEAEAAATKMAAEEAAAAAATAAEEAAAAAATAAEEAAAAAATAAEERLLTDQEIANIRGLIVAANALVGTLTNASDDAAIAAAQGAVMAASDAVGNAMRLSDAQTAMYTSHVTVSGLRLAAAEANIQAARNLARAEDAEGDIQAVADAKMAVTDAIAALGAAQTAQSAADTTLKSAQAAVTAAGNALGTTDDPDGEVAAYTSAQVAAAAAAADYAAKTTALTTAQAALGAANMQLAEIAPDASELAYAQAALAAAITAADNAKMVADAAAAEQAKKITELEETVDGLEQDEADRVAAAAAKAHSDMSKRIATALAGFTVNDGSNMNVDASTISAAGTISTKDFVADPAGPPAISGWKGLLSKNEKRAGTDIIAAYTNIDPPESTSFSVLYGDAGGTGDDTTNVGTGVYTVGATANPQTTALVWGSNAKTATGKTLDEGPDDNNNFKGTYNGVPGLYKGSGTDWTFTLDSKTASVSVKDTDFLTFGWWKEVPTTGSITFEPFAFGTVAYDGDSTSDDLNDMSATYEGPAAGLYASRNIVADEADYGKFTAEAELTAHFGAEAGGGARIGGTVDGFADENGDSLGNWTVTLMDRKLIATLGGIDNRDRDDTYSNSGFYDAAEAEGDAPPAARTDETAFGGAKGTSDWQGQFTGNRESDDLPAAVIGTFNADVGQALAVTGSFAAENTKADN